MGRWGETMGWTTLINTSKRDHTYGTIEETMGKKTGYGKTLEKLGVSVGKRDETRFTM